MIALVSAASAQSADPDLPLLTAALGAIGVESRVVNWDDPDVVWAAFDAAIVRSTWDYPHRRREFVTWCESAARATELWNPPAVIAWNTDKRYLSDLETAHFPVVPTMFTAPGDDVDVSSLSGRVVIKPSIGADAEGAAVFDADLHGARKHLLSLLDAGRTAMVQPYQVGIDNIGETGLVYLGGEFSHAFRKPALLDGRSVARDGSGLMTYTDHPIEASEATAAERNLADRVMVHVSSRFGRLAYARVDLVPSGSAHLVLELELTEPSLFLDTDPGAPDRAAQAFATIAQATGRSAHPDDDSGHAVVFTHRLRLG